MNLKQRVQRSFQEYAKYWVQVGQIYEALGVYRDVAQHIPISDESTWIELGIGDGRLVRQVLRNTQARPTVVGIDVSKELLVQAAQNLSVPRENVHFAYDHTFREEGLIFEAPQQWPVIIPGQANLLLADIRADHWSAHYFSSQKADVVTSMEWGFGDWYLDEAAIRTIREDSRVIRQIREQGYSLDYAKKYVLGNRLKNAAAINADRSLKHGGKFINIQQIDREKIDRRLFIEYPHTSLRRIDIRSYEYTLLQRVRGRVEAKNNITFGVATYEKV